MHVSRSCGSALKTISLPCLHTLQNNQQIYVSMIVTSLKMVVPVAPLSTAVNSCATTVDRRRGRKREMSGLFGTRRAGGGQCKNHGCKDSQCASSAAAAAAATPSYPAGGALGQSTRIVQPGMEMMPTSHQPVGLAGLPLGGDGGGEGLLGMGISTEIEESLKGAPPDVLAAAERVGLISPMMLGAGAGAGAGGIGGGMGGVVNTVPGTESTDTGVLSVSPPSSKYIRLISIGVFLVSD